MPCRCASRCRAICPSRSGLGHADHARRVPCTGVKGRQAPVEGTMRRKQQLVMSKTALGRVLQLARALTFCRCAPPCPSVRSAHQQHVLYMSECLAASVQRLHHCSGSLVPLSVFCAERPGNARAAGVSSLQIVDMTICNCAGHLRRRADMFMGSVALCTVLRRTYSPAMRLLRVSVLLFCILCERGRCVRVDDPLSAMPRGRPGKLSKEELCAQLQALGENNLGRRPRQDSDDDVAQV